MTLSIALDLGSTHIKAARLNAKEELSSLISEPTPPLRGEEPVRQGDTDAYLRAAERVLSRAREGLPEETPLGIASQRSSFLLWDRESGEPATPLISWQDRRAAAWCRRNRQLNGMIADRTGLVLSPHYVGPKLAAIMESDATLQRRVAQSELLLGTLDTYLVWKWSQGRAHRTDPTMAARTLLFDLYTRDWSDELLALFGASRDLLSRVEPSLGQVLLLPGLAKLEAMLADQASGTLAALGSDTGVALVNLGTGSFVLRPTGERLHQHRGYLAGPMLAQPTGSTLYALEGTINGTGITADRYGRGPTDLPERDPSPDAFCLPDSAGVGAPHWRADTPFALSDAAAILPDASKRRVALEGLLFRVREILEDLFTATPPRAVLLSGGLSRDPFIAEGLAASLGRPVALLEQREGTLLGVARLAAGLSPVADIRTHVVTPGRRGAYLRTKFERWKAWLPAVLND